MESNQEKANGLTILDYAMIAEFCLAYDGFNTHRITNSIVLMEDSTLRVAFEAKRRCNARDPSIWIYTPGHLASFTGIQGRENFFYYRENDDYRTQEIVDPFGNIQKYNVRVLKAKESNQYQLDALLSGSFEAFEQWILFELRRTYL